MSRFLKKNFVGTMMNIMAQTNFLVTIVKLLNSGLLTNNLCPVSSRRKRSK